jgi:hypothetical protein
VKSDKWTANSSSSEVERKKGEEKSGHKRDSRGLVANDNFSTGPLQTRREQKRISFKFIRIRLRDKRVLWKHRMRTVCWTHSLSATVLSGIFFFGRKVSEGKMWNDKKVLLRIAFTLLREFLLRKDYLWTVVDRFIGKLQ